MADLAYFKVLLTEITSFSFVKEEGISSECLLEVTQLMKILTNVAELLNSKIEKINEKELKKLNIILLNEPDNQIITNLKIEKEEISENTDATTALLEMEEKQIKKERMSKCSEDVIYSKRNSNSNYLLNKNVNRGRKTMDDTEPIPRKHEYYCDFCDRKFSVAKHLQKHFTTVHQKIYI